MVSVAVLWILNKPTDKRSSLRRFEHVVTQVLLKRYRPPSPGGGVGDSVQ